MDVGVALDGMAPARDLVALAREAEAAGVSSVWVAEHVGYRDAPTVSMAILGATRTVTVAPAAISVYSRHPAVSAMTAATLEEFAPGRTIFTLATGNPRAHGREMGMPMPRPIGVTREYIEVLRQLWRGGPVTYPGEFFRLSDATFYVRPARPIPIVLAAIGPRMLELAGELADGALFSAGLAPEAIGDSVRLVDRAAEKAGRDPRAVMKAAILTTAVARDRDRARRDARAFLAYGLRNRFIAAQAAAAGLRVDVQAAADAAAHGDWRRAAELIPDRAVDAFAVAGTPDECRARVPAFMVEGLDSLVVLPVGDAASRPLVIELAAALVRPDVGGGWGASRDPAPKGRDPRPPGQPDGVGPPEERDPARGTST